MRWTVSHRSENERTTRSSLFCCGDNVLFALMLQRLTGISKNVRRLLICEAEVVALGLTLSQQRVECRTQGGSRSCLHHLSRLRLTLDPGRFLEFVTLPRPSQSSLFLHFSVAIERSTLEVVEPRRER